MARPARLQSLDVLRGVTIAAMMLVNKQGNDAGLRGAAARAVARRDADRLDLPVLPVHGRRRPALLDRQPPASGRIQRGDPAPCLLACADPVRARHVREELPVPLDDAGHGAHSWRAPAHRLLLLRRHGPAALHHAQAAGRHRGAPPRRLLGAARVRPRARPRRRADDARVRVAELGRLGRPADDGPPSRLRQSHLGRQRAALVAAIDRHAAGRRAGGVDPRRRALRPRRPGASRWRARSA